MSTALLRRTLRRLQRQFDKLAESASMAMVLIEQPVLDPDASIMDVSLPGHIGDTTWQVVFREPDLAIRDEAYSVLEECSAFAELPFFSDGITAVRKDGELVDIDSGLIRTLHLTWKDVCDMEETFALLDKTDELEDRFTFLANATGEVLQALPINIASRLPVETLRVGKAWARWCFAVFDLALAEVSGSPLRADLFIGQPQEHREGLQLGHLYWYWQLDDASRASGFAIDILLSDLCPAIDNQTSKGGRPRKSRKPRQSTRDDNVMLIGAIQTHHRFNQDEQTLEPASQRQLAKLLGWPQSKVSRTIKALFGGRGMNAYKATLRSGKLRGFLTKQEDGTLDVEAIQDRVDVTEE